MTDYLCRVLIDLRAAPKNIRSDILLERFKHFSHGIILTEQNNAIVKVFPLQFKHYLEILEKIKVCFSDCNKNMFQSVQKKTIFVFNKGKVSLLEEKIFNNFEKSIELEPFVELEYDPLQRRLRDPMHRTLLKNTWKKESCFLYPRLISQSPTAAPLQRRLRDPMHRTLVKNTWKKESCVLYPRLISQSSTAVPLHPNTLTNCMTGDSEYIYSLQYCVANTVQPISRTPFTDGGGSVQSTDRQQISRFHSSIGNPQSHGSLHYSLQIDSTNPASSLERSVSFNSESSLENSQQPRHPGFVEHNRRKATFATWQQFSLFNIDALALAGFYYIGEGTKIRCFFCGGELANLSPSDDPFVEHIRKLPSCGYLKSTLGSRRIAEYQERIRNGPIESRQANGYTEDVSRATSRNPGSWSPSDKIRCPQYQAYSSRLSSFARWPSDIRQTPEQVADAGFYYTGLQDVVRCFACDGGLKNWDPEDDPWIEHARWFPQCPFVIRVKGQEFIDLVKRMTEDSDEEEDAVVHSTFQPNNPMAHAPSLRNELNAQLDQESTENVLETDAAKIALDAGYSKEVVGRTINELLIKGTLNYTANDILELILENDKGEDAIAACPALNPLPMAGPSTQKNDSEIGIIEENKRLRRMMQCVDCGTVKRDILLLPCTHLCLCSNCSEKASICPLCYKKIREKIKTYVI